MDATTPAPFEQLMSATKSPMARTSDFEKTFGAFHDSTVTAARNDRRAQFNAGRLMTDLNQIKTTMAGLGVVMRIVTANCVKHDDFDPEDPRSEPPLSPFAEGSLTAMAACICELLAERIEETAESYNQKAQS
jgi:hypothetical protein